MPDGYTTVPDVYGDKQLLVPAGAVYSVGQLDGSGYFHTTGSGAIPGITFDKVIRVGRDKALFFDSVNGRGWVYRFAANGHSELLVNGFSDQYESWQHIVYVHEANSSDPERVFFYDGEKVGTIGHYLEDGTFVASDWRSDFSDWQLVTATWGGRLVFYDSDQGFVAWGRVDKSGKFVGEGDKQLPDSWVGYEQIAPAGNEYVVFYRSNGEVALARVDHLGFRVLYKLGTDQTITKSKLRFSGVGLALFYGEAGNALAGGFYDPEAAPPQFERLKEYPDDSFARDWSHIAPLGVLP